MQINGGGSGNVNVLQSDTGQYRNNDFVTSQDGAFEGGVEQFAVAIELSHIQLENPVGSGITILIDRVLVSSLTAQDVFIRKSSIPLTTFEDLWTNNFLGRGLGVGELRRQTNPAILGVSRWRVSLEAGSTFTILYPYPLILIEGNSILLATELVNSNILGSFHGREV